MHTNLYNTIGTSCEGPPAVLLPSAPLSIGPISTECKRARVATGNSKSQTTHFKRNLLHTGTVASPSMYYRPGVNQQTHGIAEHIPIG